MTPDHRIFGSRTAASVAIIDASVVIVRLQWLNQLQNYSRDTSKFFFQGITNIYRLMDIYIYIQIDKNVLQDC